MPKSANKGRAAPAEIPEQAGVHATPELNERIARDAAIRIKYYANQDAETIAGRINELNEETDLERFLEVNAATISLLGVVLGVALSRKWLLLPLVSSALLFNHALRGWPPPVSRVRRLGLRTRREIDREKYALKALRGDFENVSPNK